jgi:hypothetical protein
MAQSGHGLRRRYEVAKDLPRELLELVGKLDAGDRNYSMRADNPSEMDLLLPSISGKKTVIEQRCRPRAQLTLRFCVNNF